MNCVSQNLYVSALGLNVAAFGVKAFKEVINVEWSQKVEP